MTVSVPGRSRRLRKKLYVDEFAVFGFSINLHLNTDSDDTLDTFINDLMQFADSRHLLIGGGGLNDIELVFGSALRYGSVTEQDRDAVKGWIEARDEVSITSLGDVVDLNTLA
ncbi:hypothetical protein CS022_24785 [Veronia nyctiphanis]|uniref:DUF469 family protein n=1 Tax=Veronia nyctiphanis TaxID=1278244 RepID=A0A4Q0Y908_9GAMM|nr:50S ribosome-binding protein YggL [Veronia nyctiphanis]RXJ65419.1 hypothetical protein CS022_24785 [Veronia nyctiphanis]